MRLGCLPHDAAKLARLPLARYGADLPPASLSAATWQPSMWANDDLGDCTVCALGHAARAWSNALSGTDTDIATGDVTALFGRVAGLPPNATQAQLEAVDGLDPMDVVETAQVSGWPLAGRQTTLVPDFAAVATNRTALALAMARTGSVMLAITLYEADMDAFEAGRPWMLGGAPGDVLGGHMVAACSYDGLADSQSVQIATWGAWQPARWDWVLARLRLGLVTGFRQLLGPDRVADYETMWQTAAA